MKCRNCEANLQKDFNYCPVCGARVIKWRITMGLLLGQLADWLFDFDNSFLRTFKGLLTEPEKVIGGYISGVRKKYMNPLSYITISLTLGAVMVFVIQRVYQGQIDFTGGAAEVNPEFSQKLADILFDFNALFLFLYIPAFTLPAYVLMNKPRYNFSEYLLAFVYILAHWSIISFPLNLAILFLSRENYGSWSQFISVTLLLYCVYVLQRLNRFPPLIFIWKSLLYVVFTLLLWFTVLIGIMLVLRFTGILPFDDLLTPASVQATSSAINWAS